jgi:hypothetical protein
MATRINEKIQSNVKFLNCMHIESQSTCKLLECEEEIIRSNAEIIRAVSTLVVVEKYLKK